jgi:tetratricopeptide (TPR) repeat protein
LTPLAIWAVALALEGQAATPSRAPSDATREKAIAAIHRRAATVAPGTAEATRLGIELGGIGRTYLERGENGRAIELLSEAYGLDEQNGLVLGELTLAYVRVQDFDSAGFYLHIAEERVADAPPEIYGVLGEIYYALNRLDDAVLAWSEFARFGGQDPVRLRRLLRAQDELALARGQRSFAADHFSVFSDPEIPEDMIHRAAKDLEATYASQSVFFGTNLRTSQVVILYAGRAYFSLVSVPDWVSGLFDGKIRVSLDPDGGVTPELSSVLAHELAHSFIRHSSGDRAPGWMHEGLAQWWEGRRMTRSEIHDAFRGRSPHTLAEMEGNLARRGDRAAARSNYVQALGIVEFLIERNGAGALACLVRGLGEGRNVADALRLETGLTPDELFRRWKEWAKL